MPKPDPYREDADKTLYENYRQLAIAIVELACLDYVMARCPRQSKSYLRNWYSPSCQVEPDWESWSECQRIKLEEAFANGLGELAYDVGRFDHVHKALHYPLNRYNILRILRERRYSGRGIQRP